MHYSSGLMITINDFDAVLAAKDDRLHPDEDSTGSGFCITPASRRSGSTSSPLVKTTCGRLVIQCGLFFAFVQCLVGQPTAQ
jgi:hypothetical protein